MNAQHTNSNENEKKSATKDAFEPENDFTLPDVTAGRPDKAPVNGSVMWAGSDALADDLRSKGQPLPAQAGGVTLGAIADDGADPAGALRAIAETLWQRGRNGEFENERKTQPTTTPISEHGHNAYSAHLDQRARERQDAIDAIRSEYLSKISVAEGYDVVRHARAITVQDTEVRSTRRDTQRSQKTQDDYDKKCHQIDQEIRTSGAIKGLKLKTVMGGHAVKKQTFSVYKSALKSRALEEIRSLLSLQDKEQHRKRESNPWLLMVNELRTKIKRFEEIDALNREECLKLVGLDAVPAKSKRVDLPRLPENWREKFLQINEASATYKDAGVLLVSCGLRPTELENGVVLKKKPAGIKVTILGGKVRLTAGQPKRSFTLSSETLPAWFVNQLAMEKERTVRVDKDALRAHLGRMTLDVMGWSSAQRAKKKITLSGYHFRHALVTDLREASWDTETIAAVIGESSAQTVSYYGTRSRSTRKKSRPVSILQESVQATRPVKPLDKSGLTKVLSAKKRRSALPRKGSRK